MTALSNGIYLMTCLCYLRLEKNYELYYFMIPQVEKNNKILKFASNHD